MSDKLDAAREIYDKLVVNAGGNKNNYLELQKNANRDPLTGLYNRRYFDETIPKLITKHNTPYEIVMMDIDYFKSVNDTYGHHAGDEVLKKVALLLNENFPEGENGPVVARYGGEEIIIYLPEMDNLVLGNRIDDFRNKISASEVRVREKQEEDKIIKFTSSFGVASQKLGESLDQVKQNADEYLYKAKQEGRNRTIVNGTSVLSGRDVNYVAE